ncbi:hypothetical protein [Vibrio cholerae]|uniref:hypothetical protein n=1 Tax=Vibrio cholerae TaxID=666 RepID=UPI001158123B|nr:hypothetical protein [Vibrio cholerae]EJL6919518.1 hypothetical protein [Vibrio cholerae]TQQ37339.1 hypothetical protein FLL70_11390 [Vibrio cholerae]TQQ57377.1 hypothetical protein FLL61_16780 [Vibrio cholerae]
MYKIFVWLGLSATNEEREILRHLRKKQASSMRVVGRGTLTNEASQVRSTEKSKRFIAKIDRIVG